MTLPAPGTTIGQYELIAQVGSGGMATVFKAHHPRLDRDVAIKMMHSMFLTDTSFVARFEREARVVARLDHPNIVPVYDYDSYNGQPYLVLKLVEGRTLKEILLENPLTLEDILLVLPAVANALTYAHQQGVLHRDVKPSNIIIADDGTPYLTDFGLARIAKAGESTMSADMLLGTPYYISPEQAQGNQEVDSRSDVYSLGVVLYELVVGRLPFGGDTAYIIIHKHIYEPPPPPSEVNPDIPPQVEMVLLKALSKSPDERYPTAIALAEAFREAVRESGLSKIDPNHAVAMPKPASKPFIGDGKTISTPTPVQRQNTDPQQVPLFSQDALQIIVQRFREAIYDIRGQVTEGERFRDMRSRAEKAFVEIKSQVEHAVEESGGEFKLNFGTSSDSHARQRRTIQREWGTNEAQIRTRVNDRMSKWRGLMGHVFTYFIFSAIFFAVNPLISGFIADIFSDDLAFGSLANINFALVVMLLWGGGLISHGLETISKTGKGYERRREALNAAMTRSYTENWTEIATDKEYKRVRNRVYKQFDRRIGLFQHFFAGITTVLAVMVAWEPGLQPMFNSLLGETPFISQILQQNVPLIFALIMFVGIFIHGLTVFMSPIMGEEATERELARELDRERSMALSRKMKNDDKLKNEQVRLTEDGEFTDSVAESLEEEYRRQRR